MSTTEVDVQGDLDKVTALVNTTVPAAVTLINDLVADNARLRAGQASTLDPVKLEADIAALNAQLGGLGQVVSSTVDPGAPVVPPAPVTTGADIPNPVPTQAQADPGLGAKVT